MPVHYDVALHMSTTILAHGCGNSVGQFDLSFFLVEPVWVDDFLRKHQANEIKTRVLIDMASDAYQPDDPYFTLARKSSGRGIRVLTIRRKAPSWGTKPSSTPCWSSIMFLCPRRLSSAAMPSVAFTLRRMKS